MDAAIHHADSHRSTTLQIHFQTQSAWLWLGVQRALALLILVGCLPLLAAAFVAVKVTSPGPFFYRQSRRGLHGQRFDILKIRSMSVGSDRDPKSGMCIRKSDPRVTPVGRVLRELKIDEIPQLWNIVRGEMEFVGPRAIADCLDARLTRAIPRFQMRYSVRPGLTNLGQISIMDNTDDAYVVNDWKTRFEAEWEYLRHKSVSLDLLLMAMTALFLARKLIRSVVKKGV